MCQNGNGAVDSGRSGRIGASSVATIIGLPVPTPPLRLLSAEEVHAALPWQALATAIASAFVAPPQSPVRTAHPLSDSDSLLLMPAWDAAAIGVKLVTVIPTAASRGGRTVEATYLLLDRTTGAPLALLDGEALTVRRTAATSVLAARALARTDPHTLLVIGTGRLAPWMLRAYAALLPSLQRLLVWGRSEAAAAAVATELRAEGVVVEVAQDRPAAVASADIVSCVTTATEPVVRGAWLRDGVHLDLVGGFTPEMRESDDSAIARARVVVDTRAGAMPTAGDLVQPLAAGVIAESHVLAELAEVLRGTVTVRRDARDVTLFKSVGHALEDFAAAQLVVR
jgi:alanine dehydrogenase